jgi:tRNA (guanine37-N1)-methyltransferase
MVLKPEPIFRALDGLAADGEEAPHVVLTSPQGTQLTQQVAERLARTPRLALLCGRYEGVDERVRQRVTEELSIGDYVLSGGELAAAVVIDAIGRLQEGALNDAQSAQQDSFSDGLLDCPHYTRPERHEWGEVPPVLMSGDHAAIARWRRKQALGRTWQRRPDLLEGVLLDEKDKKLLVEFQEDTNKL